MWNERECQERRLGLADVLSGWAILAAILAGTAVWTALRLLTAVATAPPEVAVAPTAADGPPRVLDAGRRE